MGGGIGPLSRLRVVDLPLHRRRKDEAVRERCGHADAERARTLLGGRQRAVCAQRGEGEQQLDGREERREADRLELLRAAREAREEDEHGDHRSEHHAGHAPDAHRERKAQRAARAQKQTRGTRIRKRKRRGEQHIALAIAVEVEDRRREREIAADQEQGSGKTGEGGTCGHEGFSAGRGSAPSSERRGPDSSPRHRRAGCDPRPDGAPLGLLVSATGRRASFF